MHLETYHTKKNVSQECTNCENILNKTEQLNIEFILVKDLARGLMDEKKAHKMICEFSKKCTHTSSCHVKCFYNDKEFVIPESNSEDSDESEDEDESDSCGSDDDESDATEILANESSSNQNYDQEKLMENEICKKNNLKCEKCNFSAKSLAGLSNHSKAEHQIQCKDCEIKTTTKVQLKLHKAEHHG